MAKAHHRRSFGWDKNLPWIIVFSAVAIVIVGVFGPTGMFTGVAQEAVYVVGQNGLILKSTDGGENWEEQDSGTTERLNTVYFTSVDTGFAAGLRGTLLKTIDGGEAWEQASVNCGSIDPCNINDIHFPTTRVGYAAGWETYLKTSNRGNNWEYKMRSSYSDKLAIFFTDENTGYLAGKNTKLDKIEENIIENLIPNGNSDWNDIHFTDENTGYIVSSYGQIRKTTTAGEGENWWEIWETLIDIDGNFKSIYFTDENTGYVAGVKIVWHGGSQGGAYHTTGTIMKTTDAGENWEELDISVAEREDSNGYIVVPTLRSIHFANSNYGYAVGDFGTILKTEDAGENWELVGSLESPDWFTSVFVITEVIDEEEEETGVSEVEGAARAFVPVTTGRGAERTVDSYYAEDGAIPVKEGDFVIFSPNTEVVGDTLPSWIERDEGTYTDPTVVKWYEGDRRLRSISMDGNSPFSWSLNTDSNDLAPYVFESEGEYDLETKYIIGQFDHDYCSDGNKAGETELSCIRSIDENDFPPGSIIRTFGIPGGQNSAEYTLTMNATKPDGTTVLDYITVHVRKTSYDDEHKITVILAEPEGKTQKTEEQLLEEYEEYLEEFFQDIATNSDRTEEWVSRAVEEDLKVKDLILPSLNSDAYEYTNSIFSRINNFYEEASNGKLRFNFYVLEKTPGERYQLGHDDDYYCGYGLSVDLLPVLHREAKNLVKDNGGKIRGDVITLPYIDCFLFEGKYMPPSGNIIVKESEADIIKGYGNDRFSGNPSVAFEVPLHELGHWLGAMERYDGRWYQFMTALLQGAISQYSTMGPSPGKTFSNTFDAPTLMSVSKMEDWIDVRELQNKWSNPVGTYSLRPILQGDTIRINHWLSSDYTIEYRTNHPVVSVWERNIEPAVVVTKWNNLFDDSEIAALLTEEGDSVTIVDIKITLDEINEALGLGWSTDIKIESQSEGTGAILEMKELTYEGEDATQGYDEIDRHLGVYPNLDLHATVTYNGNEYHVGIDYEERIFDCPSFAQCSGDSFSSEWMFFPASAEAEYYITDHDTGELNLKSSVDIEYTIQYFDLDDEGRSMTKEYEGAVTNNAGKFTSKHYTTPQSSDFVLANDKVNFMPMNQDYFKTLELDLDILSRTEIYDIGDTIIVDVESILENPNTPVFDAPGGAGGGTGGGGLGGGVGFS